MQKLVGVRSYFVVAFLIAGWSAVVLAQTPENRIVRQIDEAQVVTLAGNVHPMARGEFDQGAVSLEMPLERMMLQLDPSAAQQEALDALVEAQHDPQSPLYRAWLTPAEYGARFGASAQDVTKIAAWLEEHGFTVEDIPVSNRLIVFSGTAGQVLDTFHTEIHHYLVNGATHIANAQDPQIPEALAGVVSGVVSLHDFRRVSAIGSRTALAPAVGARSAIEAQPQYSSGSTHYLFPADWATIYDLNSLYGAGTNGTGSSIAIVGRSNINLSDVAAFRTASGLVANNPTVILVSTNPGLVSGDQDESTLDVEWSGAVAPSATVKFVVGASTATSDGVDLSAQYIVNNATAPVMSTSYGSCELDMGLGGANFYSSLWLQAASEGISAFVSSGDSGASGCYGGSSSEGSGLSVNGLCSSPNSTCVGGTEFNEGSNSAKYWSATNGTGDESALGYIPEEVWNESALNGGSGLWASGGGASIYFPQPSWQKGVSGTSAANGMRAVPDVAMSASGHDGYMIYENGSYWVIAGTSAASPTFAGVMALVVEARGGKGQGNANTSLYPLLEATHNPFHATPSGNNSVPGVTGFTASGASYNLATGLGSVDGAVLVSSWPGSGTVSSVDFALAASVASGTVVVGKSSTFTVSVTESGAGKNAVTLSAKVPAGVTATISPASITPGTTATVTVTVGATATAGAQSIVITGSDASGTQTATYALTVTAAPTLTLTASPSTVAVVQGAKNTVSLTATTGGAYSGSISFTISGLPAGVTAGWSANPLTPSLSANTNGETLTLTASATATVGNATVVITAAGDGLTSTQNVTLQVQAAAGVQLSAAPTSVSVASLSSAMVTFTATPAGGVAIPAAASGSSISVASGLPKGFTATWSAAAMTSAGAAVWTLTLTGSSTAVAGTSTLSVTAKVVGKSGAAYSTSLTLPMTVTQTPPTLTAAPASTSLAVMQGATVTEAIALTGSSTFSGTVSLSVSGLPVGVTATWSGNPATLTAESGKSTLTLTASSTAAVGSSTITVTASGDGVTATKQVTLQVQQAPAIQLTTSPTSVSMQPLASTTVTVTAMPVGGVVVPAGATGATISVASGLPKGFTAAWSAPSLTVSGAVAWTLTLTGSSTAAAGSSTLSLSAKVLAKTGTAYTASLNLPMTVTAPATPPTLTVAAASASMTLVYPIEAVSASQCVASQVFTLTGGGTFSGTVNLSVSGLPSGLIASWSSNPVTLNTENSGSSTLTLTAINSAGATPVAPGSYTITVTATGDGLTVAKNIQVLVAGLAVTPAVTTLTIHRGSTGSLSITTSLQGGASGVTEPGLAANASPNGITVTVNPASISAPGSGIFTFVFTVSSTAALSTYQLDPSAALFANAASTTPTLIGWSAGPVTLNIVQ